MFSYALNLYLSLPLVVPIWNWTFPFYLEVLYTAVVISWISRRLIGVYHAYNFVPYLLQELTSSAGEDAVLAMNTFIKRLLAVADPAQMKVWYFIIPF